MLGGMVAADEIETVLGCYPRIYFACHLRHVRDESGKRELSAHQASVLDHLDAKEGTGVRELAEHMGVTASTMSLTLDRLARGGYVERTADSSDGRRTLVLLTAAGERIKRQQKVLDPSLVAALLAQLSGDKRCQALAGLKLLAGAADDLIRSKEFSKLVR
jgi:MarR family transcriptional regulator, organic hydroperoxide resistance regulator